MVVLLSLLAWAIPNETVPRIVNNADGSTQYVFQPVQESILWVVGAVLLVTLVMLQGVFFRVKKQTMAAPPARTGVMRLLSLLGRGAGRLVLLGLLAMLAMVFVTVIVLVPSTQFRSARLDDRNATLQYLYRIRTIPLNEIQNVRLQKKKTKRKGTLYTDLQLVVQTDSGDYQSVDIRRQVDDQRLPRYVDIMEKFVLDMKSRLKVPAKE